MSIHPSRKRSMALSYVGFALTLVWLAAALVVIALGWFSFQFEAWRAVYLLAPLAVVGVMWRGLRGR